MVTKWKVALKVLGSVIAVMLYLGSLPAKLLLFASFYDFFAIHWHNILFRTLIFVALIPLPFIFEIVDFWRPRVKVVLTPSGAASSDLVLRVTNIGKEGDFRATCEVVGSRETCGIPLGRIVDLKWEGIGTAQVNLAVNLSANLLIASYDRRLDDTSWLRLWGIDGQDKKQLAAASWERTPHEKLPEFDLKLNIFRAGSTKPQIAYFTVRPESYVGPLQMFTSSSRPEAVAV